MTVYLCTITGSGDGMLAIVVWETKRMHCYFVFFHSAVPRPPPSPEIRLTEGRFVASVKPSLDLFVE